MVKLNGTLDETLWVRLEKKWGEWAFCINIYFCIEGYIRKGKLINQKLGKIFVSFWFDFDSVYQILIFI